MTGLVRTDVIVLPGDLIIPEDLIIRVATEVADQDRDRRGNTAVREVEDPDPAKTLSLRARSPDPVHPRRKVCLLIYQIHFIPFSVRKPFKWSKLWV